MVVGSRKTKQEYLVTVLHSRQTEIKLSGHFLHLCFELTWVEISQHRVDGHLTNAS